MTKTLLLFIPQCNPPESIDIKQILRGIREHLVTVTTVEIDHTVFLIRPHYGEVTPSHNILDTQRVVLRRDRKKHLHIRILTRRRIPLIPFARWHNIVFGQVTSHRMFLIICINQHRLRRPDLFCGELLSHTCRSNDFSCSSEYFDRSVVTS